jgi:predicted anti-sigma-YlaC factor YlaD
MMQCKKIQELLKTDYLDREVNLKQEKCIREHLLECPQCRRLEEELQVQRTLFQEAKQQPVPAHLWQNIRDAIITEGLNPEPAARGGILQRLKESIFTPQPVFALASTFTVIILVLVLTGTFIQKKQLLNKVNIQESIERYSLNGENGDFSYALGTMIEEYFL